MNQLPSYIDLGRKIDEGSRYPNFSLQEYLRGQGVNFRLRDSRDHTEYSTNCPKCVERGEPRPDTKGRLWVNPKLGTFVCYNCKWDGPLVRLIQHYSHASYESALGILRGKAASLDHLNFTLHQQVFDKDEETTTLDTVSLPNEFRDFKKRYPRESVFTEYLKHRGIPLDYAIDHSWGYAESGYTRNRIIVPTYINGELAFWQARDVLEESHPAWGSSEYRKVLNPRGVSANKVLYNYDDAKEFQEIIIVEGFVDAVKVGDNAVATNGKTLHPAQMDLLTQTKAESICILWDYDAHHDERVKSNGTRVPCSVERAADMLRAYFEVRTVELEEGVDAGDYAVGELNDILY